MKEILGIKGDGCGWNRNIFIQRTTVADIGPHGECHRFGLWDGNTGRKLSSFRFKAGRILPQIVPGQLGYLGSLQLNGSLLLPLLSTLSRSLALAGALALDLGLHFPLLLQGDI